jgi:hypothetical protein
MKHLSHNLLRNDRLPQPYLIRNKVSAGTACVVESPDYSVRSVFLE